MERGRRRDEEEGRPISCSTRVEDQRPVIAFLRRTDSVEGDHAADSQT